MIRLYKQQGFTLIEILVVVAIVAMISSVIMVGLSTARAKGRDARRKTDLVQLQKALELYQNGNNGYPATMNVGDSCGAFWGGISANANASFKQLSGPNGYIPNLAPNFVSVLPVDPLKRTDAWSGYLYCSDGISYKLLAHNSGPENFPLSGEPFYDPARPTWAWMVCSGSSACDSW